VEFRRPLLSLNTLISCNEDEDFMRRVGAPLALNLACFEPAKKISRGACEKHRAWRRSSPKVNNGTISEIL